MKIVIASGKGGTGKTTLSVSLFKAVEEKVQLLDCDVEAPNCHLFLDQGKDFQRTPVKQLVPLVDGDKCTSCGICDDFCQFNAIVSIKGKEAMIFPELCHSCGGCMRLCPTGAITEEPFEVGFVEHNRFSDGKEFITGKLNIGLEMAPPIIKAVFKNAEKLNEITKAEHQIIDAPPGTACPFVTTVSEADYVIFITEPTPFGLHDLKLAISTIAEIGLPFGVVINRIEDTKNLVSDYCAENNIDVLLQIENSRHVAEFYSKGLSFVESMPELKNKLQNMMSKIIATPISKEIV